MGSTQLARGSIQLRHRKGCTGKGKDSRSCRCAPTVYAVLEGRWDRIGYLPESWRKADLVPFEERLTEMREAFENGRPFRRARPLRLNQYAERWFAELHEATRAGRISKFTYNNYAGAWQNHIEPVFGRLPLPTIEHTAIRRWE